MSTESGMVLVPRETLRQWLECIRTHPGRVAIEIQKLYAAAPASPPTPAVDFVEFPKIPRLSREIFITEKIDGTNACVFIGENGEFLTGSRTKWITPDDDNHGFSRWAHEHRDELMALGAGRHFGEWWGQGIQRKYGLSEKRFSLFNVGRWNDDNRPACCNVVPTLYRGIFDQNEIDGALERLRVGGSLAATGFTNPEGIIVYHAALGGYFKKTLSKDEEWKGKSK